jgi:hypothetical protein
LDHAMFEPVNIISNKRLLHDNPLLTGIFPRSLICKM